MKNPFLKILAIAALLFFSIGLNKGMAQTPPTLPGSSDGGTNVRDVPKAPINGLVALALVLGACLGAREIKERK